MAGKLGENLSCVIACGSQAILGIIALAKS